MNTKLKALIAAMRASDELEASHIADVLAWLESGVNPYRIAKPDNPPKHLVSYFVPYDPKTNKIMLISHKLAGLWLPPGGHIELNEHPKSAVIREAQEELAITADFSTKFGDAPLFITVTQTRGFGSHTDVSLWYVIALDSALPLAFDEREMGSYMWLSPQEILQRDSTTLDPHMHRFVQKMLS